MSEGWKIVIACNVGVTVVLAIYVQVALNAISRLERKR